MLRVSVSRHWLRLSRNVLDRQDSTVLSIYLGIQEIVDNRGDYADMRYCRVACTVSGTLMESAIKFCLDEVSTNFTSLRFCVVLVANYKQNF